jgi:hypothetical protein
MTQKRPPDHQRASYAPRPDRPVALRRDSFPQPSLIALIHFGLDQLVRKKIVFGCVECEIIPAS